MWEISRRHRICSLHIFLNIFYINPGSLSSNYQGCDVSQLILALPNSAQKRQAIIDNIKRKN